MYEDIKKVAATLGLESSGEVPGRLVPCDPTLRRFCEQNLCGMYGNCYMCPPAEGAVQTLITQIHNCKTVIVFEQEYPCPDLSKYMDAQLSHEKRSQLLWMSMQKLGYTKENSRVLTVGGCHLCDECAIKTGEPCRHPDMSCPSVSGYCIEAAKLAQLAGLNMNAENGGLKFMTLVLIK